MSLLDFLNNYQYLIVGILGFAGVIFTLWFNSSLARNQRFEARKHQLEALRSALLHQRTSCSFRSQGRRANGSGRR